MIGGAVLVVLAGALAVVCGRIAILGIAEAGVTAERARVAKMASDGQNGQNYCPSCGRRL